MCIKRMDEEMSTAEAWKLLEKEEPESTVGETAVSAAEEEKELNAFADNFFEDLKDLGQLPKEELSKIPCHNIKKMAHNIFSAQQNNKSVILNNSHNFIKYGGVSV